MPFRFMVLASRTDPWLLAGGFLAILYLVFDNFDFLDGGLSRGQMLGRDFVNYWSAGHLLLDGRISDLYDIERYQLAFRELTGRNLSFNTFPYPPHGLWLVLPLGWFPYFPSLAAWILVTFAICAYVLARFSRHGWKAVAFLAFAPSAAINISSGQNGFVSAALLCGGLLLVDRRPVLAGVLLGLLTYKPQLGLLIPFALLIGRHWTVIASATATVAILLGGSILLLGLDPWRDYVTLSMPLQRSFAEAGTGFFQLMIPTPFMAGRNLGLQSSGAYILHLIVALPVALLCTLLFRSNRSLLHRVAILLVGAFLVSPYAFNYDMVALGLIVYALAAVEPSRQSQWALRIVYLLPALMVFGLLGLPVGPIGLLLALALLISAPKQSSCRLPTSQSGLSKA